ncbi:MAG TPA: SRPBCC family protein [Candidatus Nanopelagicales bacterium]
MPTPTLHPEPICVERVVPAPPEAVFDLLARPDRHRDFDGSGTVQAARSEGRRVRLGDSFGMDMHWGVPYATRNVVTEFEEGRRIAWRTLAPAPLTLLFTGRTWRYELEPVPGGTRVRECWDVSTEALPARFLLKPLLAEQTRVSMQRTLERIEDLLAA